MILSLTNNCKWDQISSDLHDEPRVAAPPTINFDETSSGEEAQEILSLDQIPWK